MQVTEQPVLRLTRLRVRQPIHAVSKFSEVEEARRLTTNPAPVAPHRPHFPPHPSSFSFRIASLLSLIASSGWSCLNNTSLMMASARHSSIAWIESSSRVRRMNALEDAVYCSLPDEGPSLGAAIVSFNKKTAIWRGCKSTKTVSRNL